MECCALEVRVRQLPFVQVPKDLDNEAHAAAAAGWQIDHVVTVMAMGFFGGSNTDTLLVFLERERDQS